MPWTTQNQPDRQVPSGENINPAQSTGGKGEWDELLSWAWKEFNPSHPHPSNPSQSQHPSHIHQSHAGPSQPRIRQHDQSPQIPGPFPSAAVTPEQTWAFTEPNTPIHEHASGSRRLRRATEGSGSIGEREMRDKGKLSIEQKGESHEEESQLERQDLHVHLEREGENMGSGSSTILRNSLRSQIHQEESGEISLANFLSRHFPSLNSPFPPSTSTDTTHSSSLPSSDNLIIEGGLVPSPNPSLHPWISGTFPSISPQSSQLTPSSTSTSTSTSQRSRSNQIQGNHERRHSIDTVLAKARSTSARSHYPLPSSSLNNQAGPSRQVESSSSSKTRAVGVGSGLRVPMSGAGIGIGTGVGVGPGVGINVLNHTRTSSGETSRNPILSQEIIKQESLASTSGPSTRGRSVLPSLGRGGGRSTSNSGEQEQEQERSPSAEEDRRVRNTAASAKFRQKKKQRLEHLRREVGELDGQREVLWHQVEELKKENGFLKKMVQMKLGFDLVDPDSGPETEGGGEAGPSGQDLESPEDQSTS
ncbi:hypothetical protein M231_02112 [Tremella mesenterica]|uniref:BZIP domain-containing protein n=1 Tax=Tremella mesenterica TaxID=5217 RepID=A0A4Q1BRQ0_TREME|nr:hypothetical protein M231_02112 [Tremella mesenterica]